MHRSAIIQLIVERRIEPIPTKKRFDAAIERLSLDPAYKKEIETSKPIKDLITEKNRKFDIIATQIQPQLRKLDIRIDVINGKDGINTRDDSYNTALSQAENYYSSSAENRTLFNLLLENGADPNIKNNNGFSPLTKLAFIPNSDNYTSEIARLLITHGADINIRGGDNKTLLMNAAFYGRLLTVKVLLEYNANPLLTDQDKKASNFAREFRFELKRKNRDTSDHDSIISLLEEAEETAQTQEKSAHTKQSTPFDTNLIQN